jgi:protein-S-isoprenylcysteine O-methyltransferase Ste14
MNFDLQTKKDRIKAWTLVFIQLLCVVYVLLTAGPLARHLFLIALQIAGAAVGIWALIALRLGNMNISPLVKKDAVLVTTGPYRFARHPMYLAVLFFIWPIIIDDFAPLRLIAGIILTVDLIVKLIFEETLLKRHFAGYDDYMKRTRRLLPLIF